MIDRLDLLEKRYEEINNLLMQNEVISDVKKSRELSIELKSIEETVVVYRKYKKVLSDIEESKEMIHDPEIADFAKEELTRLNEEKTRLEDELKILLLPKDENDGKNVIMEIRGAAGGDEANIFAGDLYRMYSKYCESHNFKIQVTNADVCEAGGFSQIELIITGNGAYSKLKYESGVHRVQRIPVTETSGRIHTSTATVLVIPEAEDVDFELNMEEIRVDIFHSSGAGGQGVNTTSSAIRVTHLPTGTIVTCQDERSQHENKAQALKVLKSRLYDRMMREKEEKEGAERLSKIGTGDRSEKIRTYNYPQNRITDHRINFTIQQLDRVMEGKLDPVIDALGEEELKRKLEKKED